MLKSLELQRVRLDCETELNRSWPLGSGWGQSGS